VRGANPVSEIKRAPVTEMAAIAVSSASAPELIVVEDVSWSISAGDFWVLAGLPGAGKGELLAVAGGVQRPARGTVRLFGKKIDELSEDELLQERLCIGLVFGVGGRLFNQLTVAENVALPLRYHRNCAPAETRDQVAAILEWTGLTPMAENLPQRLSRGWRQRVGLARALVLKPELLLVENLFSGLEPSQIHWWKNFLAQLSAGHEFRDRKPMTLVVATHDLQLWTDAGQKFALLKDRHFYVLGGRSELAASQEPLLRELRWVAATGQNEPQPKGTAMM
jgi:ABC-type transporter Mla maintaining outer membrane lipid asymmetry ATPase subunit MlaF